MTRPRVTAAALAAALDELRASRASMAALAAELGISPSAPEMAPLRAQADAAREHLRAMLARME